MTIERRLVELRGLVQGVGMRPYVYRLARSHDLRGRVRNHAAGVLIDVEGERDALGRFLDELGAHPPPLAGIESTAVRRAAPRFYPRFSIDRTRAGRQAATLLSPDLATCGACLAELFDPRERRFRYPFLSCTQCGPRFTIVRELPYDRAATSMARFAMCEACRSEYQDPEDRRFHAETIACAGCGPALRLAAAGGADAGSGETALAGALALLREGGIVAVKGLGGYHFACDATDDAAVATLRTRKHRDAKPFAIMVRDLAAARELVHAEPSGVALLEAPERPIVLARRRTGAAVSDGVAPGSAELGIMLPYTPLHHLLLSDIGRPLVMTSGNLAGEPIAVRDDDARRRLGDVADALLSHDRPIENRCDDSVVRVALGGAVPMRRSRGFAPRPLRLPAAMSLPVVAVGGHLKNTFCLARGDTAFVSHHIGDLDGDMACAALRDGIAEYGRRFDIQPALVAHDLHPGYGSTRVALELECGERIGIQHHEAHVASCLADNGETGAVIGMALDGSGLGHDGAVWGGELLLMDGAACERMAHLAYVALPGGEAAVRQPWRMALAHLWSVYGEEARALPLPLVASLDDATWKPLRHMLTTGFRAPLTSSAGRLFDAIAALCGITRASRFEGEAAMALEAAAGETECGSYPAEVREAGGHWIADPSALIRGVVDDVIAARPVTEIAAAFHDGLRDLLVSVTLCVTAASGVRRIALTGGVFQNRRLLEGCARALSRHGLEVLLHRRVPCNDGGLSLGQAVLAERRSAAGGR